VLVLAPAAVSAATFYTVEVIGDGVGGDNGFTPVSAGTGGYACFGHGYACAGAFASADLSLAEYGFAQEWHYGVGDGAHASASFSGYDVVLSGPSGESTLASLNLTFDGVASLSLQGVGGSASVSIGMDLSGPNGATTDGGSISTASSGQVPTGSGLLAGWMGGLPLNFSTASLLVGAGDVITVGLNLAGSSVCDPPQNPTSSCNSSFDVQGFSFATTGPVFNLPAGWTANSVDGTIVNNRFVPEPATAFLIALGLLGLTGWRRRAPNSSRRSAH